MMAIYFSIFHAYYCDSACSRVIICTCYMNLCIPISTIYAIINTFYFGVRLSPLYRSISPRTLSYFPTPLTPKLLHIEVCPKVYSRHLINTSIYLSLPLPRSSYIPQSEIYGLIREEDCFHKSMQFRFQFLVFLMSKDQNLQ